jgi:hypothetical protein
MTGSRLPVERDYDEDERGGKGYVVSRLANVIDTVSVALVLLAEKEGSTIPLPWDEVKRIATNVRQAKSAGRKA